MLKIAEKINLQAEPNSWGKDISRAALLVRELPILKVVITSLANQQSLTILKIEVSKEIETSIKKKISKENFLKGGNEYAINSLGTLPRN